MTIVASTVGLRQNITLKANVHKSFVTIGRKVPKIELFLSMTPFFFPDPGLKHLELKQSFVVFVYYSARNKNIRFINSLLLNCACLNTHIVISPYVHHNKVDYV